MGLFQSKESLWFLKTNNKEIILNESNGPSKINEVLCQIADDQLDIAILYNSNPSSNYIKIEAYPGMSIGEIHLELTVEKSSIFVKEIVYEKNGVSVDEAFDLFVAFYRDHPIDLTDWNTIK